MKTCLTILLLILQLSGVAQTPGLSVALKMDSVKAKTTNYKIEMKICEPNRVSERGDWFSKDTSDIVFASLKGSEINCNEYMNSHMDYISGKEVVPVNGFKYSANSFAWEKIIVFRIANPSSKQPAMYVVVPMKYKSFVTHITLSELEFHSGKIIFLTDYSASRSGMFLSINQSLKGYSTTEIEKFSLKKILTEK